MPELPEVETVVRALRRPLVGRTFSGLVSGWPRQIVRPDDPAELAARISGRTVTEIRRRAKYIVMALDGGEETLIVHLKMTGHLAVVPGGAPVHPHVRQRFLLRDGDELHFRDPRKFGRVYLVREPEVVLGRLGPEPLADEFTLDRFLALFGTRSRPLKPLLLDQEFIAGIGNIYADEALFAAGLHPERRSDRLTGAEKAALYEAIREVLRLGIAREGASISDYVKPDGTKGEMQEAVMVFRRTGFPCTRCGTPIARMVLGGRSTHFCPSCQK